jgi:hypothetical protein
LSCGRKRIVLRQKKNCPAAEKELSCRRNFFVLRGKKKFPAGENKFSRAGKTEKILAKAQKGFMHGSLGYLVCCYGFAHGYRLRLRMNSMCGNIPSCHR